MYNNIIFIFTDVIIGFSDGSHTVAESGGSVTLPVLVRGGRNRCNKTEWSLKYIIRNISAQGK